jgi:hypothetical protein
MVATRSAIGGQTTGQVRAAVGVRWACAHVPFVRITARARVQDRAVQAWREPDESRPQRRPPRVAADGCDGGRESDAKKRRAKGGACDWDA